MEELGLAQAELTPEQILEQYGKPGGPIDEILKACRDQQFDYERQVQINRARYNWRMVRGDHFIAPGFTNGGGPGGSGELVDYVSIDSFGQDETHGADVSFAYPINVLGGDLWKFVAVMGQSAPRVKAVADDIENPVNIKQA